MSKVNLVAAAAAAVLFAGGCAVLEPKLPEASPAIAAEWPIPATAAASDPTSPAVTADIGWREFFADERLEEVIARALANNRDLRVAILNVEKARAQYRIQRANRVPSVGASVALTRTSGVPLAENVTADLSSITANLGITEFELDLFGRVRNLSQAALQRYFAQEENRRSAQLALIAGVANVYLTLAADQEQLRVAQATLETREDYYELTRKRFDLGGVSALDLSQARTQMEAARAEAARYAGQVALDTNVLNLLVGAPVGAELLPATFDQPATGLAALPAGLPSEVLLRRPDVLAAEHLLRAANANIGAARAAFFPSITLTGTVGSASNELTGLFDSGTRTWSFVPRVNVPIFQGGRLRAGLGVATADRDIALAQYEKAIQAGFRDVADALALTATLAAQRAASEATVEAAAEADRLSRARYEAGRDSFLVLLDAQRTLYLAQQALITTRLAEQANRVTLYKVLGGGWRERNP